MQGALYLEDSYLKEFEAEVKEVSNDNFIVLDKTAFYPKGGGQPNDTGTMKTESEEYKVVFCGKFSGKISHEVDKPGLKIGDKVNCVIDWDKRYKLMRSHTAAHILSAVIHKATEALITGNQLELEKSRIDFSVEKYDPEKMKEYIEESNKVVGQDLPISADVISREEAMKIPSIFKLAKGFPESMKEFRILKIGDFDTQADGGTHVRSTKEVGKIELIRCDNKGKNNRRVYFRLMD